MRRRAVVKERGEKQVDGSQEMFGKVEERSDSQSSQGQRGVFLEDVLLDEWEKLVKRENSRQEKRELEQD